MVHVTLAFFVLFLNFLYFIHLFNKIKLLLIPGTVTDPSVRPFLNDEVESRSGNLITHRRGDASEFAAEGSFVETNDADGTDFLVS